MIDRSSIAGWIAAVPPGVWIGAVIANLALTATTWSTARKRMRRAGERLADPDLVETGQQSRDTALTLASMVPAGLFWLMVLGGSLHGLVAFGRTTLGWHGGWEYLVPGTLDGVSVTFAMLAFRAVKRGKAPDRCYRVVWGAALASATINFAYEYGKSGNVLAGGYVAMLSLFGMLMFDEFLNQFEQGVDTVRRQNPKFGVRWLTWPTNTQLAAVAWRNHPPPEGTAGTVANAVANLECVRAAKRDRRRSRRRREPPGPARPPGAAVHADGGQPTAESSNGSGVRRPRSMARTTAPATTGHTGLKVPTTPAAVLRWAQIWMTMHARPEQVEAAVQDDELAREHFGCSGRQLRHVRYAATSGALRRRAQDLAVPLPAGFDEAPVHE
jgi:hypothetical protein